MCGEENTKGHEIDWTGPLTSLQIRVHLPCDLWKLETKLGSGLKVAKDDCQRWFFRGSRGKNNLWKTETLPCMDFPTSPLSGAEAREEGRSILRHLGSLHVGVGENPTIHVLGDRLD